MKFSDRNKLKKTLSQFEFLYLECIYHHCQKQFLLGKYMQLSD